MRNKSIFLGLGILAWFFAVHTAVLHAEPVTDAHTQVELAAETQSVQPGETFWVGVYFKPEPGWHIYWKNPGDSGLPPEIHWRTAPGIEPGLLLWPYPETISAPPLMTYGYHDEVLLLNSFSIPHNWQGGEMVLKASVNWLACEKVCIPGKANLELSLPATQQKPISNTRWADAFSHARARLPLQLEDWKLSAADSKTHLTLKISQPSWAAYDTGKLYFFPAVDNLIQHAQEQKTKKISGGYELTLVKSDLGFDGDSISGVLVSEIGWRGPGSEKALAVEIPFPKNDAAISASSQNAAKPALILIFVSAFLGGLILNLMPCVLPVLSIKILGLLQIAAHDRKSLLRHGVFYTLGVLAAFSILGIVLMFLRAGGAYLGWGFQLQSPVFLIFLAVFFLILAMNLFGVFEIRFGLGGMSSYLSLPNLSDSSSFFGGVLATLIATPCTAPFMGTALAYALTQPSVVGMLVFFILGLGMALPYLCLTVFPGLLSWLPKPGPWMLVMKKLFSLLLFGTVLWLSWIYSLQTGRDAAGYLLFGLFCTVTGIWLMGQMIPLLSRLFAAFFFMLAFWCFSNSLEHRIPTGAIQLQQSESVQSGIRWKNYSQADLQKYLRQGKPVFIDFTAAWCLTCQVNEKLAFSSPEMAREFSRRKIIALRADWTAKDAEIARALAEYGRNSIPLYVYYPPQSQGKYVLLPELITPRIVLNYLEKGLNSKKERI